MIVVLAFLGLSAGFFLLRGLSQSGSSQNVAERSLPQPGAVDSNEGDGDEALDGGAPLLGHMLPEQERRRQEREKERLNRRNPRQSGSDFSDSTPLYIPDSTPSQPQPHSPSPGHHDGPSSGGGSGCASSGCAGSSCGGSSCGGGGGCGS